NTEEVVGPRNRVPNPQIQPTPRWKKEKSRKFQKQNLNLLCVHHYLHSIYTVLGIINLVYKHTSKILWIWFQTTKLKRVLQQIESHEYFGSPVPIKVMFTLYCSLFFNLIN
uniref:Uncharacterized protein n=1 Tax=Monodon monoceros TaxID=40151 RepID=A0A8C6B854_MONMO